MAVLNMTNWLSDGYTFVTPVQDTYPFISDTKAGSMRGRSVLITGASKGIGLVAAVHFARAGCSKIALAARSPLDETEAAVRKAAAETQADTAPIILTLNMDVSSTTSVQAAAEKVKTTFGTLDVLINNAGFMPVHKTILDSDPDEYWTAWETNMKGTYLCAKYFLPLLLDSQLKTMVNMASSGGHALFPDASAYQTSKFALCRFTEFLDEGYAHLGLVAFALHPGATVTEMGLKLPEELHDYLTDTIELPADILVWLCKERREWLRGRFVAATWNMEEFEKRKDEIVERDLLKFRMLF